MLMLVPLETALDDVAPAADATVETTNALLLRVAAGDQRAFGDLYDLIAPRMLGLVRHVLRDHAQSEEVVQEVLLEVWQTAPRFDPNKGKAVTLPWKWRGYCRVMN